MKLFDLFQRINKQAILIGTISFLMSFSSAVVMSCAVDFSKYLGIGPSIVVLSRLIGESSGYIGRFIVGFISDVIGDRKKFLLLGYGTIIIIKPIFIISSLDFLSQNTRTIIYVIGNISEKFFGSIRDPIRDAWLTDYTKQEDLSSNLIIRRFMSYSGSILGALFSFCLNKKLSYQNLFICATIPAFIGVLILYRYIHNSPTLTNISKTSNLYSKFISDLIVHKKTKFLIVLLIGILFLFIGKINEFSLWFAADQLNIKESNSLLFILYYISSSLGSLLLSVLLKYLSPYIILIIAASFMMLINYLIPLYFSHFLLILSTIYYGIYGAFLDVLTTLVILRSFYKLQWKATIISLLNLIIGIAFVISGFINKSIIEHYSIMMPFRLSLYPVFLGISILTFVYIFFNEKKQKISINKDSI